MLHDTLHPRLLPQPNEPNFMLAIFFPFLDDSSKAQVPLDI